MKIATEKKDKLVLFLLCKEKRHKTPTNTKNENMNFSENWFE